jgi:hypothetical protein
VWWELRVTNPLLDVYLFRKMRFTAASLAITLGFFALFGFIFLVTQYVQLVKGYSALRPAFEPCRSRSRWSSRPSRRRGSSGGSARSWSWPRG